MTDSDNPEQIEIVRWLRARGYLAGWNADQFAARQLVKLMEELAEAMQAIEGGGEIMATFLQQVRLVGLAAHNVFDEPALFEDVTVSLPVLLREFPDLVVPVAGLAHAIEVPDMMAAGVQKARADAVRGVRVAT